MKKMIRKIATLAVLLLVATSVGAADTIREFRGTGNATTAVFTVDSPWLLDWRLDGDYVQMVALEIALVEAPSGRHVGRVLYTKRIGNGLKLFKEAGQYQLRISSSLARWTIKIQQIQPEEADQYTPRGDN
jgi:hypothetical protein